MENNHEMLANLEKNTRQQLLFTKILCGLCVLLVVCMLVLTVAITGVANEVLALSAPLQELSAQIQTVAKQAETVMTDLGAVAQALAAADLGGMVEQVDILATDSQTAVTEAMAKLDTIDIATLNKAIKDLAAVVEPLAKVSKIWG